MLENDIKAHIAVIRELADQAAVADLPDSAISLLERLLLALNRIADAAELLARNDSFRPS